MKITSTIAAIAVALSLGAGVAIPKAHASDGSDCGYFVFVGAFKSYSSAARKARRVGGEVYDLDYSDSPSAGRGFYAVTVGSSGSRRTAEKMARGARYDGDRDAYVAFRCFD